MKPNIKTLRNLPQDTQNKALESLFRQLISLLGDDPDREALQNTPRRAAEAWRFWTNGYTADIGEILAPKKATADDGDEMIVMRDIPIYSHCENHMAPIVGTAYVAYIPGKMTTGLANISRLVDVTCRRLQTQERLTKQIADALEEHLKPVGVAVVTRCQHMCLASRSGRNVNTSTISKSFRGAAKNDRKTRDEFLSLIDIK